MFKVSTTKSASDSKFLYILVSTLFLSFHYFLVTYVNSSLLAQFLDRSEIGILYALGSILSIAVIINMPKIISKWSAYKVMLSLSVLEIGILFLLGSGFYSTPCHKSDFTSLSKHLPRRRFVFKKHGAIAWHIPYSHCYCFHNFPYGFRKLC